jgi:hypothetical protein
MGALVATFGLAGSVAAQPTPLERWTLVGLDGWMARASGFADEVDRPHRPSLRLKSELEAVSFRSHVARRASLLEMSIRAPVAEATSIRASASRRTWSTHLGDRPFLVAEPLAAVALGIQQSVSIPWIGSTTLEAHGGWGRSPGGSARVRHVTGASDASLAVWRAGSRGPIVHFPADSLRDLSPWHRATGLAGRVEMNFGSTGFTVRPRAEVQGELLDRDDRAGDAFLSATPEGDQATWSAGVEVGLGPWTIDLEHRGRDVDLESDILRTGASAGRIPIATAEFRAWRARVGRRFGDRAWLLNLGSDRLGGTLSARVETWPFVELWETLSTQAYRLNGGLDARSIRVSIGAEPTTEAGWTWRLEAGRYVLRTERDSWFVTSLGFGRRDRVITASRVDPAYLVGTSLERAFLLHRGGTVEAHIDAGMPVLARTSGSEEPRDPSTGPAGYVRGVLEWRW